MPKAGRFGTILGQSPEGRIKPFAGVAQQVEQRIRKAKTLSLALRLTG